MKYSYLIGAGGDPVTYKLYVEKARKGRLIAGVVSIVIVFGLVSSQIAVHLKQNTVRAQGLSQNSRGIEKETTNSSNKSAKQVKFVENAKPINIDAWLSSHSGQYSISIYDDRGASLVEHNPNSRFFMASIYKLYVAYVGYQKMDRGEWRDDVNYLGAFSRSQCLYEMIHSSNNPCGEKMLAEIGRVNIETKLSEFGLEDTSINAFETSSQDVATILIRLQNGVDLRSETRQKLLDSMKSQIYRDGLPAGFSGWAVDDKVGFREQDEYHDAGIVTSPSGQVYIVSVLSNKAHKGNVADLARFIKSSL